MDPKMTVQYLNDHGKSRMVLLALAGLLLIGGTLLWVHMSKEHESVVTKVVPAADVPPVAIAGAKPIVAPSANPPVPAPVAAIPPAAGTAPGGVAAPAATGLPVLNVVNRAVNRAANTAIDAANVGAQTAAVVVTPVPAANTNPALSPPAAATAGGAVTPAAPQSVTATSRTTAAAAAKVAAGRVNPYEPVTGGFKPYPRNRQPEPELVEDLPPAKDKLPKPGLVPPPPPSALGAMGIPDYGLSVDELPAPPSKPSLADKMKLVAVIGDRAVLKITDKKLQKENKWPSTLTLGHGDAFESVNVIDVNGDSVTLDEDGERSVKTIDPLR
jgi:hypothetical protein